MRTWNWRLGFWCVFGSMWAFVETRVLGFDWWAVLVAIGVWAVVLSWIYRG